MVVAQLAAIESTASSLDNEGQRHFRLLFEGGVKHFLATPRACTRLLNVMRFTYPTLAGQVYFPDMLGICCLMSFSSQAIQAMRSFSDYFVGHCDTKGQGWVALRDFHTAWLAQLSKSDRPAVESIVRSLFPKVAWALNGPLRGEEHLEAWQKRKRVCSPKHFDTYFRLGLSAGEVAEYQWQHMVELLDDATAFAQALQRFGPLQEKRGANWVDDLLQKAADFVNEQATPDQARKLFRAIMRRGDQLAAVTNVESRHSLFDHIHWVVSVLLDCLLRIEVPSQRLQVLRSSVSEDAGLLTAAELLDLLDYRVDIFADATSAPTAEASTTKLLEVLKILDGRIQQASQNGELAQHPQFMKIVQKWYQFGRKSKSRRWIRATCENDERFVDALIQVRTDFGLDGAPDQDSANALPVDLLIRLFDRNEILARAAKILGEEPDWLTPEGANTLTLLAQLLQTDDTANAKSEMGEKL
jgi:predicted KAP-like P-loop ATPase